MITLKCLRSNKDELDPSRKLRKDDEKVFSIIFYGGPRFSSYPTDKQLQNHEICTEGEEKFKNQIS
jgi:hypothetical protein